MEGWIVFATVITALAGLVAASAAVWLALQNRQLVKDGAAQVSVSQQQRYDQLRPLIVPESAPVFQDEPTGGDHAPRLSSTDLDEQGYYSVQRLSLRNIGPGPALNVLSLLCVSETLIITNSGGPQRTGEQNIHWTCWLDMPLTSNAATQAVHIFGRTKITGVRLGKYKLNAPPEPDLGQIMNESMPVHVARLTISYHDVFGRKHKSVFDYVLRWRGNGKVYEDLKQHGGWEHVEFAAGTEDDLHDLLDRLLADGNDAGLLASDEASKPTTPIPTTAMMRS